MSLVVATKPELFCLQVTRVIDQMPHSPINVKASTNVLDTVMSASNTAGWAEINRVSLPGKPAPNGTTEGGPKIWLQYEKPYCDGGESNDISVCDATGTTEEEQAWLAVNINKVAERHFTITKAEFANFCESPNDRLMDQLKRKAFEIKREINSEAIKALYAIANPYTDGTASIGATTKELTVISPEGNIIPAGFAKINGEYARANYSGRLLTFGGETLRTYIDVKGYQGMSMNSVGANVDPLANMPFTYDNQFDTIFQTLDSNDFSHGFTLPLGAFVMQEWFDHEGYGLESLDTVIRNKMTIDGITYDYSMVYDPCGGSEKTGIWKVQLKKRYGFGSIPNTAYCDNQGLNFHWLFGCGDFSCSSL